MKIDHNEWDKAYNWIRRNLTQDCKAQIPHNFTIADFTDYMLLFHNGATLKRETLTDFFDAWSQRVKQERKDIEENGLWIRI